MNQIQKLQALKQEHLQAIKAINKQISHLIGGEMRHKELTALAQAIEP
jgi:hypothetical protein